MNRDACKQRAESEQVLDRYYRSHFDGIELEFSGAARTKGRHTYVRLKLMG